MNEKKYFCLKCKDTFMAVPIQYRIKNIRCKRCRTSLTVVDYNHPLVKILK